MSTSDFPPVFARAFDITLDAQRKLQKPHASLEHALSNSTAKGLPDIAVAPQQGRLLSILCQTNNAKEILEIGTLGGYSTIFFAESHLEARVTAIEIDAHHRDVAIENLEHAGVAAKVDVRLGAALNVLPKLEQEGKKFDFVFIDADWDHHRDYFAWAVKLARKGALIYVDNVIRTLTHTEDGLHEKGMALIEYVKDEPKVEASLIPTVSTHKKLLSNMVDGFLLALVK